MRILDVSPRIVFPPRAGAAVRIYHLLRHLSKTHEVRQFSQASVRDFWGRPFDRSVKITPSYCEYRYRSPVPSLMSEWCRRSWLHVPVVSGSALRFAHPSRLHQWLDWADVTLVETPWQFGYCLRRKPSGRLVLATHNLEVVCRASNAEAAGVKTKNNFWLRYAERLEREAVTHADLILTVSPEDRQGFVDHFGVDPARIILVPNGADTEKFQPVDADRKKELKKDLGLPDKPTVVYLASNPKAPHRAGLAWVRAVARRMENFTFLVVGGLFSQQQTEGNLIATGAVEDPCPYLQSADFSLCPIQYGGGTKIKVLESLAVGLPTVVFAETILGTALRHGSHVWVSDSSADALVAALRALDSDPILAERLGRAGRDHVREHHDWNKIAENLNAALQRCVQSAGATQSTAR